MTVQVFDAAGTVRDWAWLVGRYGRLEHLVGGLTGYALAEVREMEGPALLKVKVVDQFGAPARALVVLTWPSLGSPAGDLPDLTTGDLAKSLWARRGVAQWTDAMTGLTGFGLGGDSWIKDFAAGGPYHVWVFDKQYFSDCLSWIGWLGGTNHRGPCDLTFKLAIAGVPDEPPEPDGETLAAIEATVGRIEAALQRLGVHLGMTD